MSKEGGGSLEFHYKGSDSYNFGTGIPIILVLEDKYEPHLSIDTTKVLPVPG